LQEVLGIRDESSFKAASGLHGGMGKGDVCGSLLGGSLMIGLMSGKSIAESGKKRGPAPGAEGPDTPARLVGELYDWFHQEFGTVRCKRIQSRYEKELEAAADAQNFTPEEKIRRVHARCDKLCGQTAARTVELLWDVIQR
jgi:hypothetical protein